MWLPVEVWVRKKFIEGAMTDFDLWMEIKQFFEI